MTTLILALALGLPGQCQANAPRYQLADATGQVWVSCDPAGLSAHVAAVNASLGRPQAPAATTPPAAGAVNYGVDLAGVQSEAGGTFHTNAADFRPQDYTSGPGADEGRRPAPAPPPAPQRPDLTLPIFLGVALLILLAGRRKKGPTR